MGLISCTFHSLKLYTIMAAYSTEGEMSQDRIDQGGLYGSLYSENKTWEVARYISVIEAAILMGIVCPLHLPLDRADHFKIVAMPLRYLMPDMASVFESSPLEDAGVYSVSTVS